MRIACIFSSAPGVGGLGVQIDNVLVSLAGIPGARVQALGPLPAPSARSSSADAICWLPPPRSWTDLARSVPLLRRRTGMLTVAYASSLGRWASAQLRRDPPEICYAFTQVALESFEWCARRNVPAILESPNGHIDHFRQVYVAEQAAWCGGRYLGHPTEVMCRRVKGEYELARHIRASSRWTANSLAAGAIPRHRIVHLEQPVDLVRYQPHTKKRATGGPLHVCFVGSLDLRKGFVYLLDAVSGLDPAAFRVEIVGASGDRCSRRLLEQRMPSNARVAPGDPAPAYCRAEVFVLPTLEDGSPFAAAEAMAAGLPVIVTSECGAAEWVRPETGWVIPPRDTQALRRALVDALDRRESLPEMGRLARADTQARAGEHAYRALADWVAGLGAVRAPLPHTNGRA